jgi:serine/threonine-protein phosphatase PP1-1
MSGVKVIEKGNFKNMFILGDIHGDLKSLENLLGKARKDDLIITLGDYADRGPQGVEVIRKITDLQKDGRVIALKGNHEVYSKNGVPSFSPCDFIDEVCEKETDWSTYFKKEFTPFVDSLYLAAIVPGQVLFVHGGVSSEIKTIDDIINNNYAKKAVLWADPSNEDGEWVDPRSGRIKFGPDVTNKVCSNLNVDKVIRSHEPDLAEYTYHLSHSGKVLTTSSTTCYGGNAFALRIPFENIDDIQVVYSDFAKKETVAKNAEAPEWLKNAMKHRC